MPSSYSTNLKIELQATGENSGTWGTITNTNLGTALEQAVVGYGNPSYTSDANLTLTYTDTNAAQAARALVLNVTSVGSLTATRELIVPTIQKQYIVQNNTSGAQSITVKTSGGTGITVTNGRKAHLYVDGTNVIFMDDFVDINGGAIDGTTIGASSAAAGTFTTLGATTGNITTVNATTVDTTNIEVTNLKAKDGTAAGSIADSTGVVTLASSVLTTTDINGGTIDGTTIGGSSAAAGTFTTLTASSIATFAAGSAAAPSITTTGDTNTGIFFPAADTIGFTEGGVEAARIDSSGNLGIGVTPSSRLDVVTGTARWKISNDGSGNVVNENLNAAGSAYSINNSYALQFVWGPSGTEAMRLNASGNLGIGTSSPAFRLDVATTTGRLQVRTGANTGGTSSGVGIAAVNEANSAVADLNIRANILAFITDATERARIDSSGNVGIGMTPNNILDITQNQNSSATSKILNNSAGAGARVDIIATNGTAQSQLTTFGTGFSTTGIFRANGTLVYATGAGGLTLSTDTAQPIYFATNQTERMRLDSSGNLGLGVTPSASTSNYRTFQIGATGSRYSIFGQRVAGASETFIGWNAYGGSNTTTSGSGFFYTTSGDTAAMYSIDGLHKWFTAPSGTADNAITFTQAMTLDASGRLGIGASSVFSKLYLKQGADGTSTEGLVIEASANDNRLAHYYDATNNQWVITATYGSTGAFKPFTWWTSDTKRMTLDTSGNLLVGTTSTGLTNANSLSLEPSASGAAFINHANGSSSGNGYIFFGYNGSAIGSITQSGTAAVLYNVTSDQRLKENIVDAPEFGSVIDSIQVRSFSWKTDNTHQRAGFVAQELVTVAPEAVYQPEDTEQMMAVDYSKLVPMLVKEIQSLRARVAQLESK